MLSSPGRSKSPGVDGMSASITALLQWFSKRPILALIVFILTLLIGSVFVPFVILDYFSSSFQPTSSGTNQLFGVMSSERAQMRLNLQNALGLDQGAINVARLAQHGHEYAAGHTKDLSNETIQEGVTDILDAAQIQRAKDERRAKQEQIAHHQQEAHGAPAATPPNPMVMTIPDAQQHTPDLPPAPSASHLQQQELQRKVIEQASQHRSQMQPRTPEAVAAQPTHAAPDATTPSPPTSQSRAQPERAAAVVKAFKHAYGAYEKTCFGQDEYHPLSKRCSNWIGSGLTIIDALPTMILMGEELKDETRRAQEWVEQKLSFTTQTAPVSFFETTIRVLGGLISAFDLTGFKPYLNKAKELGEKLLPVFNTPSGLPRGQINLMNGQSHDYGWTGGSTLLAEVGTCQMEFFALAQRTGEDRFRAAAQKPLDVLERLHPPDGLYPIFLSVQSGQFTNNKITFGAMGDSMYEYLLKVWLLTGKTNEQVKRMYLESMQGMITKLLTHSGEHAGNHYYLADLSNNRKEHKMDHLVCFVPGMLALGVKEGIVSGETAKLHMDVARKVMKTCFDSYDMQPTKIGPEYMTFNPQMQPGGDASYKLRPEMLESLFLMFRLTGDEQYREWGWQTFEAIERACKIQDGGYAALLDVRNSQGKEDKMESFFLAETLKYLYLMFADESKLTISGNKKPGEYFVFNTECHPIKSWQG